MQTMRHQTEITQTNPLEMLYPEDVMPSGKLETSFIKFNFAKNADTTGGRFGVTCDVNEVRGTLCADRVVIPMDQ
jgi:hypothetical protein